MVDWHNINDSNPKIVEKRLRLKDIEFDDAGSLNESNTNDCEDDSLHDERI